MKSQTCFQVLTTWCEIFNIWSSLKWTVYVWLEYKTWCTFFLIKVVGGSPCVPLIIVNETNQEKSTQASPFQRRGQQKKAKTWHTVSSSIKGKSSWSRTKHLPTHKGLDSHCYTGTESWTRVPYSVGTSRSLSTLGPWVPTSATSTSISSNNSTQLHETLHVWQWIAFGSSLQLSGMTRHGSLLYKTPN